MAIISISIRLCVVIWLYNAPVEAFFKKGRTCSNNSDCRSQNCVQVCGSSTKSCVEPEWFFKRHGVEVPECIDEGFYNKFVKLHSSERRELGETCVVDSNCISHHCLPRCGSSNKHLCIEPKSFYENQGISTPECVDSKKVQILSNIYFAKDDVNSEISTISKLKEKDELLIELSTTKYSMRDSILYLLSLVLFTVISIYITYQFSPKGEYGIAEDDVAVWIILPFFLSIISGIIGAVFEIYLIAVEEPYQHEDYVWVGDIRGWNYVNINIALVFLYAGMIIGDERKDLLGGIMYICIVWAAIVAPAYYFALSKSLALLNLSQIVRIFAAALVGPKFGGTTARILMVLSPIIEILSFSLFWCETPLQALCASSMQCAAYIILYISMVQVYGGDKKHYPVDIAYDLPFNWIIFSVLIAFGWWLCLAFPSLLHTEYDPNHGYPYQFRYRL